MRIIASFGAFLSTLESWALKKRPPRSAGSFLHLFEISPHKDFALANLATVHLKLGDHENARACAGQMSSPEFAVRKARILERIGRE